MVCQNWFQFGRKNTGLVLNYKGQKYCVVISQFIQKKYSQLSQKSSQFDQKCNQFDKKMEPI